MSNCITQKLWDIMTYGCPNFWQSGSAFIKPDQLDPWIKDQLGNALLSTILPPTVTKFCVVWEGLSLPQDTKFGNCRGEIVHRRMISIWSLIHGSGWSGLIKADPSLYVINRPIKYLQNYSTRIYIKLEPIQISFIELITTQMWESDYIFHLFVLH